MSFRSGKPHARRRFAGKRGEYDASGVVRDIDPCSTTPPARTADDPPFREDTFSDGPDSFLIDRGAYRLHLPIDLRAIPAAGRKISVQFDKNYDYTKVRSFSARIASPWGNPFAEKNVLAAIEEALVAKGWARGQPGEAEAVVLVHGTTESLRQFNTLYSGGGWRFGGMGTGTITESEFTVGTLVVDVFASGSQEILFRGVASGELSANPEKNARKVHKAVAKMFKDFPPPAPSPGDEKR